MIKNSKHFYHMQLLNVHYHYKKQLYKNGYPYKQEEKPHEMES